MLDCPRDGSRLEVVTKADDRFSLQGCRTCKGAWLDAPNIKELCPTAAHLWEHREEVLLTELMPPVPHTGGIRDAISVCPSCGSGATEIVLAGLPIDFCTHCGGLWLDGAEALELLREPQSSAPRAANPFRESARALAASGATTCGACTEPVPIADLYVKADGFYCVACFYTADAVRSDAARPLVQSLVTSVVAAHGVLDADDTF